MHTRNTFPTTHIHRYSYLYPVPQHLCSSLGEICWLRTALETASSLRWRDLLAFSPLALSPLASSLCLMPEPCVMLSRDWGSWGILCPGCNRMLPKNAWRPCQWKSGRPDGGSPWGEIKYTMCRECQPLERWQMDPQGLTEPRPDEELDRLSALLGQAHGAHLE